MRTSGIQRVLSAHDRVNLARRSSGRRPRLLEARSRASRALFQMLVVGALAAAASAQAPPNSSGGELRGDQAAYDVQHYDLALRVDPASREIRGRLTMRGVWLGGSSTLGLELESRLEVTAVLLDGAAVASERPEGRIVLDASALEAGAQFAVSVDYGGKPREAVRAPWDGGFSWAKTADGSPWIATSCQGEGADVWWPCKDHPSDKPDGMDLRILVPDPLIVASNGRLISVTAAEPGWSEHHWRVTTPIANYTVALNIAPYRAISTRFKSVAGDEFDFTYWVLPENYEKGLAIFDELQAHLAHLESICGPYPFRADKYGVVETPHLGMEHQTIIAYGNKYRGDPTFDYDWLHHHELSHEWWANLVTAADWSDMWIHEGIGTYTQALYLEQAFGKEAYHAKLAIDLRRVENKGAVAPRGPRTTKEIYFASNRDDAPDIDIYMKGAWICHTLRWYLGDETFFRVLRRWAYPDPALERVTDGSQVRFATTDELLGLAEKHSGLELGWFFEVYLRQPHLPALHERIEDGVLHLAWEAPAALPFTLPVPVRVGDTVHRVEMPAGQGQLTVGDTKPTVDPDHWILKSGDGRH